MNTPSPLTSAELDSLASLLSCANEQELEKARQFLTGETAPPVWTPLPGPQTQAFYSQADELFYGGAGGGGKSDLLLGLAGTAHRQAVIFRREFPRLRAMIERSREIYNARGDTHAKDSFNESTHIWRLLSGRLVEFAAIQHEKDKENQRGRPRDFYGWDEVTEFTESMFRFVNAWNRSTVPGQRCRVVATGNPPTSADGEWVIRYWGPWLDGQHPRPAMPGELRWFVRVSDREGDRDEEVENDRPVQKANGEVLVPRSRTFIPARLADNPILAASGYGAVLQGLPEPLRSQMLFGDFSVGIDDNPWQVIPTAWVRAAQARWQPQPPDRWVLNALGVDVARGGRDKTAIARRYGNWFAPLVKHAGRETDDGPKVAALVLRHHADEAIVAIDVIGIGSSAYDCLKDHDGLRALVIPVNNAAATEERDRSGKFRLVNVRAASYWKLREALDPEHGDDLALPPDPELLADLCAARYQVTAAGIKVEPKEDIVERLGRSPDCGDAVVMAHWSPTKRRLNVFA